MVINGSDREARKSSAAPVCLPCSLPPESRVLAGDVTCSLTGHPAQPPHAAPDTGCTTKKAKLVLSQRKYIQRIVIPGTSGN